MTTTNTNSVKTISDIAYDMMDTRLSHNENADITTRERWRREISATLMERCRPKTFTTQDLDKWAEDIENINTGILVCEMAHEFYNNNRENK